MKMNRLLLSLALLTSFGYAEVSSTKTKNMFLTAELQGSQGNKEAEINALIKKLDTVGYSAVAANKNLQVHYYNKYEERNVEMLSFFAMTNKEKIRPLLLANPDFGAYAPFNFLVYKTLDTVNDNNTWYGHLATNTMLDIIGEKNIENRKAFSAIVDTLDEVVTQEMHPKLTQKFEHSKPLPKHGLTKFVMKFEKTDDLETFIEEFLTDHDSKFSEHEFLVAGFIDYKFEYGDMELAFDKYDAYWVSLLCHFEFSNAIFNRGIPEGGMFAPCSVYFYIPKGSNELHVGYATVDNWINALNLRDEKRIKYMRAIDAEVGDIFKTLGFTKVDPNAKVESKEPVVLVAKTQEIANIEKTKIDKVTKKVIEKPIEKKKEVVEVLSKKVFKTAKVKIGAGIPENQSAYYAAQPQHLNALKETLEKNGFKILSENEILKGHTVLSITNPELQATNTYMAVLNLHLNGTEEIRIQNPSYLGAAYLGDEYKNGMFADTLKALESSLGEMYEVTDNYESDELSEYHFMMGMPRFDDVIEVAEGENLDALITSDKKSKYVLYTLKLPNGATLVGHKLRSRTNKFLTKIAAERNANLLPYQSLVQNGKAVMLDPKYYLALSLPLLSMSDFMKIAAVPGAIEKEIKRAYK